MSISGAGSDVLSIDLLMRARSEGTGVFSEMSEKLGGVGKAMEVVAATAVAVGASVATAGVAALDMASKYTTASDQMASLAGITQSQAKAIGDAFLNTAGESTFSAQAIMDAYAPVAGQLGFVEGHALSAADATRVMAAAQNLAEATGASLADTTSGLANVMQAYQIPIQGAAAASDELFNVSRSLDIPISNLADTVDKLHAKLGPLAPSLGDVSSLLLDVEQHGLTGSRALLLVSTGMNTLLGNTKPVNAEIAELGLSLYDATGNFVGMGSVISQLQPKLAGMTEEQRLAAEKILFGSTASKALDSAILAGLPAFDSAKAAADKLGTAHQGAVTATNNLGGAVDRAKASLSDFGIKAGEALLPFATTAVNAFSGLTTVLAGKVLPAIQNDVIPAIQHAATWIGDHLVPAGKQVAQWFGEHVVPVLKDVGGFLLNTVVPGVEKLWDAFSTHLLPIIKELAEWFTDHLAPILITIGSTVIPILVGAQTTFVAVLADVLTGAMNVANFFAEHWPEMLPILIPLGAALTLVAANFAALGVAAVASAVASRAAWLATNAQMMVGWAALAVYGGAQAIATAASWVAQAAIASAAWVASKVAMLAAFAETVAQAIIQAAATAGAWVAQAIPAAAAWVGDFVTRLAGAGSSVVATATVDAGATATAWETAATGAEGAFATAYGAMAAGAAAAATAIAAALAPIVVVMQGIQNAFKDFKESPLGQGTGPNPLPPPNDFRSNIPGPLGTGATGGKFAGPYGTFLGHAQGGGKYFSEGWIHVGEGDSNPEWVINNNQAGSFAPLLDALVFGGASQASPASGGGGGSALVPLLGGSGTSADVTERLDQVIGLLRSIAGTQPLSAAAAAMRTGA